MTHRYSLSALFRCPGRNSHSGVHFNRGGRKAAPDCVGDGEFLVLPFGVRDLHGHP